MYIVYKHITPSGKIYIGQTNSTIDKRAGKNGVLYKFCPYFFHAIEKYGWENIEHITISDNLNKKEADWLERYLIAFYQTNTQKYGYNLTLGGDGVCGRIVSEETRKRIKNKNKGKHHSVATEFVKGHTFSKEVLEKISLSNKGKKLSDETKHKMSVSRKGKMYNMKPVLQYKNGLLINEYKSITEASEIIGISRRTILNSLQGKTGEGSFYKFEYK